MPIKSHSQICSAFHNILLDAQEYNNLIMYEHRQLDLMKEKLTIQKPTKRDLEKMRIYLPTSPVIAKARAFVEELQQARQGPSKEEDALLEEISREDAEAAKMLEKLEKHTRDKGENVDVDCFTKLKVLEINEEDFDKKGAKKKNLKSKVVGASSSPEKRRESVIRGPGDKSQKKSARNSSGDPDLIINFALGFKEK